MSDNKIVLKADHGHVDKAADKTHRKYEGIAKTTKDMGKATGGVADEMSKWGKTAANTLIGIGAVLQMIGKVGNELKKQRQEAVDSSKKIGGSSLERSGNLRKLGLTKLFGGGDQAEGAVTAQGAGKQDEIDALLGQAAGSKEKVSPENVMSGVRLLNTGLFTQAEVADAMSSRSKLRRLESETADRGKSLTKHGAIELATRVEENKGRNATEGKNFAAGIAARATDITRSIHDTNNPITGFLMNTAEEAPVVGSFFGKIRDYGSTPQSSEIVKAIAEQSKILRQKPRPNLNTDAGGN